MARTNNKITESIIEIEMGAKERKAEAREEERNEIEKRRICTILKLSQNKLKRIFRFKTFILFYIVTRIFIKKIANLTFFI